MENVRIAIRDSTDSHNVAFFDNISGIRYQSANLQRFLAGSASILTIEYNSKDIDTVRTGCKLAFIYKERAYWLNIMDLSKKGYKVEITAYSLGLELNQEERGAHKPANAMRFAEYLAYYDPEHALELGVNEVADKRIKLEWTGTDTILARLFSIANSFDAELEFTVELNQDYSLKRQVLNVYKKGNLGSNRAASPIRVGRGLKVINYSDNLKELRTAVRATGKDGLTIDGLNKKVYDDDGNLLYYSNANTVYAPQSRDKYPSVGKKSNDNWIIKELGETEYSTKEALWGYMLGELKKICVPEITYDIEGAVDGDVGDTRTLIDDVHYDPPLYVQARISELTEDLITGRVTKSTLTNFERKYSQIADSLLKQVEALAEEAAPYIVRLSTDNGYNFKNGQGTSTITAKLEKYSKIVNAKWKWLINNSVVSETSSVKINASQVNGTLNVVAVAIVGGNEAAREYITLTNADDGVGIKSITRYYTTNDKAEGVTAGGQNWSTKPTTPTADKKYMWSYDVITYTNDTSLVTKPAVIGARGDDGLDADTTGITEALEKAKQELTALSANIEKVRNDSLAAVEEAKQQLTTVADDLSKAKTDLQNAVSAVDTKATNLQSDLTKAKQDLTSQASQLQAQASAQSELTKRVSTVEKTANGTKTTVSELSKTVTQNGKDITSVTAQTKTVEDDLANTKTTLTQVQTTANRASQKTAALETGLNGLSARFSSLRVGGHNYLRGTSDQYQTLTSNNYILGYTGNKNISFLDLLEPLKGETVTIRSYIKNDTDSPVRIQIWFTGGGINGNPVPAHEEGYSVATGKILENFASCNVAFVQVGGGTKNGGTIQHKEDKLEKGNIATDYSPNDADLEQKVAEYKQNADQNYASLQTTVQNLDGTVQANKTTAEQTAAGFKTRIESLETYKSGESTRANQYFESAKTETARQLTAERTAIAKDYVAKSTYTSDVTGIRNDLTATTTTANTTKTNLANYQASNDKAVANLQSNLQTANGNISSLKTKVEAVPGQITSAVSAVEGKIPKSVNTVNLIKNTDKPFTMGYGITNTTWDDDKKWAYLDLTDPNVSTAKGSEILPQGQFYNFKPTKGMTYTQSILIDTDATFNPNGQPQNSWFTSQGHNQKRGYLEQLSETTYRFWSTCTWQLEDIALRAFDWYGLHTVLDFRNSGTYLAFYKPKLTTGTLPSDWSPAPEDTVSQISSLSSQIQQTADGMTLLATKTELNSAKTELQSGITTATNKANTAQSTAANNAKTISTHTTQISALNTGLSAKVSQTDFNTLSGRVTTAENNITAKANELSSKITSVEGKIPTSVGGRNYIKNSEYRKANIYVNDSQAQDEAFDISTAFWQNSNVYAKKIKLSFYYQPSVAYETERQFPVYFRMSPWPLIGVVTYPANTTRLIKYTIAMTSALPANFTANQIFMRFRGNLDKGRYHNIGKVMLEVSDVFSDWQPAPEDYDSKLASAQSEIKQTTDAIKASVQSLDNSTVKSSSLTINTDGVVIKAGKSTSDFANAIGSYFAVNQNAINLFSDKINVKGSMIVDGAITSNKISAGAITGDKIAANSINSSKIVSSGITANVIKGGVLQSLNGSTNFELDTGKLFYNNNNTGVFRVQNGASTMGLKFSNTSISVAGTSRILSRAILGGDRRETTLDDGKWDKGGFSGIIIETIKGVEPAANEHADAMRVISDNIYFTHTYSADSPTGISAHGWKMETYAPDSSYSGNIVLKPYGINYRQSDIVVGDIRLDNGDGSGYWMRATINTLKNCFGHILNGGVSSSALNAIRSELNKISGT